MIDDTQDADANNTHGSSVVNRLKDRAKPTITTDQLTKAKEYIAAGGNIEAIETKYKLTAADKKELNEQKTDNTEA